MSTSTPDLNLYFRAARTGWKCGTSYWIVRDSIGTYHCFFWSWRDQWVDIQVAPYSEIPHLNPKTLEEAKSNCAWHAKKYGWFKYCPKERELSHWSAIGSVLGAVAGL